MPYERYISKFSSKMFLTAFSSFPKKFLLRYFCEKYIPSASVNAFLIACSQVNPEPSPVTEKKSSLVLLLLIKHHTEYISLGLLSII